MRSVGATAYCARQSGMQSSRMKTRLIQRTGGSLAILAALLSLTAPPAFAAGDAANGLRLARQWCASCHGVEPKATATDKAPPFAAIARRRDSTWVKAWLSDPHPPMTGIELSRAQIDDVTAYMKSLAQP